MADSFFNLAIFALIVFVIVWTLKAVSARGAVQERREAILRLVISVLGIGFICAFRYARLSLWHYLIVGGALILIHRELQNRQQTCMSIYGNSVRYRLAMIAGAALALIAFIHASGVLKLVLGILALVTLMKRQRPRHITRPPSAPLTGAGDKAEDAEQTGAPVPSDDDVVQVVPDVTDEVDPDELTAPRAHPSTGTTHPETEEPSPPDDNVIRAVSDATNEVDADQVTASYAHPSTGMAHTDAALQVYVSSEEGPVKSRARRIIIAGLTKTAAFKTEDGELNEALREIVVTSDTDILQDKLQALSERLTCLAETEADRVEPIKQKVLTVLNIVQIIAEDPDKQSKVQEQELLIRTTEVENQGMQNAEPSTQNEEVADDPALDSGDSS